MRKGEKRKAEIIHVAEELFCRGGYQKTSLNDILERVGCSKGSFYHHFETKLQLLGEISDKRIMGGLEQFRAASPAPGIGRLNALLYHSSFLRYGEEAFLAVVLSLRLKSEGAVLTARIRDSRKARFLPELAETLRSLEASGAASCRNPALPELLWDGHAAFIDAIADETCRIIVSGGVPGSRVHDLMQAARFQWERLLDIDYGSVFIVGAAELVQVLQTAAASLSLEEGQMDFDSAFASPCHLLGGRV